MSIQGKREETMEIKYENNREFFMITSHCCRLTYRINCNGVKKLPMFWSFAMFKKLSKYVNTATPGFRYLQMCEVQFTSSIQVKRLDWLQFLSRILKYKLTAEFITVYNFSLAHYTLFMLNWLSTSGLKKHTHIHVAMATKVRLHCLGIILVICIWRDSSVVVPSLKWSSNLLVTTCSVFEVKYKWIFLEITELIYFASQRYYSLNMITYLYNPLR